MYSLILYDTSNFENFPIGGQLTSVRNFLKYLAKEQREFCQKILLVGITTKNSAVGEIQKIAVDDIQFDFLPVLFRDENLSNVQKSLRIEYLKALFHYKKQIPNNKETIHYLHTPEAFIQVKMHHPKAKTVVFSHGSFFNMLEGFRFYKNNKLVSLLFNRFLIWLLKRADYIFTLDELSTKQYLKYTNKVQQVDNSVVLPTPQTPKDGYHAPLRLLFVGRLSNVKGIDKIIEAVECFTEEVMLTIVGDGEEKDTLHDMVVKKKLEKRVAFIGAVSPHTVSQYMRENDILLLNSILEGKPMTIIEAMSYGMPVVTTPVGGIAEMTQRHINCEYTDGTPIGIITAINTILQNYKKYSEGAVKNSSDYDYIKVNSKIFFKINDLI